LTDQRKVRADVLIKDLYSIIVTDKLAECRDFYVRWFGFQVVFEASWFVYLAATGDHAFGIAFMAPGHPSQPPGPETFSGKGMFITVQVADATAEFERLIRDGVSVPLPLRDEPWGQRRFGPARASAPDGTGMYSTLIWCSTVVHLSDSVGRHTAGKTSPRDYQAKS
jgi:catechol 2,3-dioxygenase-like lactoylglutathione lyase family enzyme